MGAIFGALGSETPKSMGPVRHMAETLAHRGTNPQNLEFPGGAIGYLEAPQSPPAPVRGLCDWPQENAAVAVAGQVNAPDHRAILEAFRERRLDHLRGSFVIAIRQDERVHLIRDGAGRRTIYHGHHAGQIYFAVEPKAIHTLPDFPRILRPAAVAQYLTFSFIPGPATMLENIHEVPAGHVVTLQAGCEPKLERWFVPENVEPENRGDEAWVEIFREHFGNAIDELRVPGQPAAVFLSGGIDSSIVTAELAARHDAPVKTFAIHFGERYPNELEFARSVSEHCATEHEEVRVEPRDFLPHLAEIVRALDEPIGDPVAMPNYLLAAYVARQGHDRVFNGEGGDPCFGGPKNLPMLLGHWYGGQDFSPGFRERAYLASYRRAYEELEHLLTPEFREQIDARRDWKPSSRRSSPHTNRRHFSTSSWPRTCASKAPTSSCQRSSACWPRTVWSRFRRFLTNGSCAWFFSFPEAQTASRRGKSDPETRLSRPIARRGDRPAQKRYARARALLVSGRNAAFCAKTAFARQPAFGRDFRPAPGW